MKKFWCAFLCAMLMCTAVCGGVLTGCTGSSGNVSPEAGESAEKIIVINEVMSSNSAFIPAPDGRCYDWVELRNLTGNTYDLSTCYLTDDERVPRKCQLTGTIIEPYGYVTVYLSGLNGVDIEGNLHAGFKLSSLGETLVLNDADGVVMSVLEVPESQENVSYGFMPSETGFAENSGVWFSEPTPGHANSERYSADRSGLVFANNGVVISEYMTDNSFIIYDADGDYSDWVELHNPTETDADMSGYMLTDDPDVPGKWTFPEGTTVPAGGYLMVFCSGKDKVDSQGWLHTGFSLSDEDYKIVLSTPQAAQASQADIISLPENISCGMPEGAQEWKLFARPTPGAANTTVSFELTASPSPDINDGILISETLAVSSSKNDYFSDYIEIYNATSGAVELGGYTLSQRPGEVVFTFPEVSLKSGGYLLIYCDGTTSQSEGNLHAPIKLNMGGEKLYLANAQGRIVDFFQTGKQINGVSSGRVGSDTSVRCFFTSPSPGKANSGTWYSAYALQPSFSCQGGYTQSGTEVYINVPEDCTVRYTTNGYEPDQSSQTYTEGTPITVNSTMVLKAVAYKDGCLPSQTTVATYLVEEPHSISVVSMSGFGLTGFNDGILIAGFYNNYRRGWIRDVHIEYYDQNGNMGVEFETGAQIFGSYSRSQEKKGIRLDINEIYGSSEVTYPFFPDSITGVSTFKSLLLRPSGQDQQTAMLRDELLPELIRGRVEIDYQECIPCALYVNGEYWGLYYLRERLDEDYLVSKYGIEKGKTDLVKSQEEAQAGTADGYLEMQTFARENDLTVPENYEYMKSIVDFESLCDFWIVETYLCNTDTGNIRCYRTEGGKWRWMIYDLDWAMFPSTYKRDYIYRQCLEEAGHGSGNYFSNAIIRKLLQNEEFRDLFISRYCYHMNTTFETERCIAILDELAETIRSEVPRNAEKWESAPTPDQWESNIEFLRKFFTVKPDMAKEQLMENFGLSESELNKYLKENK